MNRGAVVVSVLVALVVWLGGSQRVEAHAALLSAEPANNDLVQRPPDRIRLTFTEPLDTRSSGIRLLNASGQPLSTGQATFTNDNYTVEVALETLSPGIYNVQWFNVSSVDGHGLTGSYPFTVLNPDGSVPEGVNTVTGLASDADPPPLADGVAVRLMAELGLALAMGGAVLLLLWPTGNMTFRRGLGTLALIGSGLLFVGCLLQLQVLRTEYSALTLNEVVFETRVGGYWLMRLGSALLIAVTATLFIDAPRRGAAGVLVGAGMSMWAFAATGHGAASSSGSWWGTLFHAAHGVAAFTWIGAVVAVAVVARLSLRRSAPSGLLGKFSLLASVMVFIAMATGILSSFIEVDKVSRLFDTRYGWTLTAKLLLLVPLLGVAGYNARWGKRRLESENPATRRVFIYSTVAEVVLGAAVFSMAAMMTQTGVAKSVPEEREAPPFNEQTMVGDVSVELAVDPNRTGLNSFFVRLKDAEGTPVAAEQVRLIFSYQDDPTFGTSRLSLQRTDEGVFGAQGPYLPLQGKWRIQVEIRRANVDDASVFFDVRPAGPAVTQPRRGGAWDNPAPGLTWNEFGGIAFLMAGLGFALWRRPISTLGRPAGFGATALTAAGFGAGILLLFGVHKDAPTGDLPTNPVFPDQNSIQTGRRIYEQNCAACHGLSGVPPQGLDLDPYPLDLTVHAPQHPDGQLYRFIHDGLRGTAMRAWGEGDGALSDEEIWHVVNYLRTLSESDR